MDKDIVHFGMGFTSGFATGVLLTIGVTGFAGYRLMKNVGNAASALAKYVPQEPPRLATVTTLEPKEVANKEEGRTPDGTETTPGGSPPGAP